MKTGAGSGQVEKGVWARGKKAWAAWCLIVTEAAPSSPTKASLYGAILFTLQQTRWLPVSKASLIFVFTMFMVSCKVSRPALPHASPHLPGWELRRVLLCPRMDSPKAGSWGRESL